MSRKSDKPRALKDARPTRVPGVYRLPDPAGVLPDLVDVVVGGNESAIEAAVGEILLAASPQARLDRLAGVKGMQAEVVRLRKRLDAAGGNMDEQLRADLAQAEYHALYLKAQAPLFRDRRRQSGAAAGGASKPKPTWWNECATHARTLLQTGTERHELVGKCKRRFAARSDSAIRNALVAAGLLVRKKRRVR